MIINKAKRVLELRAASTNLKEMEERRAEIEEEMNSLVDKAEEEKRAFTEEEENKFNELEKEKNRLNTTIKAIEDKRAANNKEEDNNKKNDDKAEEEKRAFENYIRGIVEERADVNLTVGDNGAVIPSTIANKIIKKVYDISPLYQLATKYNVKGNLTIPYYDDSKGTVTMAYANEFSELESSNGKFKNIELKGYLAGALSKISKSLINNSQFDIVSFTINEMAESIAKWIEKELINGTDEKIQGLKEVTQEVTTAASNVIIPDELIDVQEAIPDVYQANAVWIMNKATRTAIRKFKDSDGNYILNRDMSAKWGYTLLGKPVYTTDNISKIEAGKTAIFYGDMSGLAVKLSEDINIEVLREKYATQHAIGIVAWCELDSKVENAQKIARLVVKSA
ncbi:MAG: phage major capsid protein [Clostridium sp.]|nr:phage major capsid protein [Clostridium sp.]